MGLIEVYDVSVLMGHTFESVFNAIDNASKRTKEGIELLANKIEQLGGKILFKEE